MLTTYRAFIFINIRGSYMTSSNHHSLLSGACNHFPYCEMSDLGERVGLSCKSPHQLELHNLDLPVCEIIATV